LKTLPPNLPPQGGGIYFGFPQQELSTAKVLNLLRENQGSCISGEELSARMGVSRTAVWKQIHQLEAAGYQVEAIPHRGYRLLSTPDRLLPDEIRAGLQTRVLGQQVICFESTGSTNDLALELAAQGAQEGTLIAAENQTRGRGRRERTWISKAGANLLFSLILRPPWIAEQAPLITLMLAVAVAEGIRRETGLLARIKWPNDVLIKDAKVAGILTEMRAQTDAIEYVVCGIGINVNAAPAGALRQPTSSLSKLLGKPLLRLSLLRRILYEAEQLYFKARHNGPRSVLETGQNLSCLQGTQVLIQLANQEHLEGMIIGMDDYGALLLRLESGVTRRITSGEVSLVRPEG
jgi:BirA family biotin operon repressor/biotin-[acetyl-CoA-carboxylase] ligase